MNRKISGIRIGNQNKKHREIRQKSTFESEWKIHQQKFTDSGIIYFPENARGGKEKKMISGETFWKHKLFGGRGSLSGVSIFSSVWSNPFRFDLQTCFSCAIVRFPYQREFREKANRRNVFRLPKNGFIFHERSVPRRCISDAGNRQNGCRCLPDFPTDTAHWNQVT